MRRIILSLVSVCILVAFATTFSFASTPVTITDHTDLYSVDNRGNVTGVSNASFSNWMGNVSSHLAYLNSRLIDLAVQFETNNTYLSTIYTRVLDIRDTLVNHATIVSSNFTLINNSLSGISNYLYNIYMDQYDLLSATNHIEDAIWDSNGNNILETINTALSTANSNLQSQTIRLNVMGTKVDSIESSLNDPDNNTNAISELELIRSAVGGLKHDNHVDLTNVYNAVNNINKLEWLSETAQFVGVFDAPNGNANAVSGYLLPNTHYYFKFSSTGLNVNASDIIRVVLNVRPSSYLRYNDNIVSAAISDYTGEQFLDYRIYTQNPKTVLYFDANYLHNSNYPIYIDVVFKYSTYFDPNANTYAIEYLPFESAYYYSIKDLYYLTSIDSHLANLDTTFDNSDVIDAINDLELINHGDEKITVTLSPAEATQTTSLIVKLRQMFSTGVSISDFNNSISDSSLLGWFTQNNADQINALNNSYVAPAY